MPPKRNDLRLIDLNLLVALNALLEEESVTRAARRLHITQPAVSQTLARLRDLFGDPLLVRQGSNMVKSPLAAELSLPLSRALAELQAVVERRSTFEPRSARRRFVIATTDYIGAVVLPGAMAIVREEAPGVDVDIRALDVARYALALEAGEIDLAMSVLEPHPDVASEVLFRDGYACLVRPGHPLLKKKSDPKAFASFPHILMSPRGTGQGIVDDALEALGLARRVIARVPMFTVGVSMIGRTDMVMTAPRRLAEVYGPAFGLASFATPLPLPELPLSQAWHRRDDADAGSAWLRDVIRRACGAGA